MPNSDSVLAGLKFPRHSIIPWQVGICENSGTASPTLYPERIEGGGKGVPWITSGMATNYLTVQQGKTLPSRLADIAEVGVEAAGFVGGSGTLFSISAKGLAKLAGAALGLHEAGAYFAAKIPNLTPFTAQLLTGPVALGPGQCATVVIYSSWYKGATPFSATIVLPPTPPGN
jgi:hypothetical protein